MITYFAYGSNLCLARLRHRVSGVQFEELASLKGHELRWHKVSSDGSGKLNVVPSTMDGAAVHGALFAIPLPEKVSLDLAEGLGHGYQEKVMTVSTLDGVREAVTYIATRIDDSLRPYTWYRDLAVAGAEALGFPAAYVAEMRNVTSRPDPNEEREARERSFIPCEGQSQRAYLQAEFLAMTVRGALGRSGTYRPEATPTQRLAFRTDLEAFLRNVEPRYLRPVDDDEHERTIDRMCRDLSRRRESVLRGGRLRVGIAQKALNLYLKYLWCAGWIAEPPHCPFDSILISRLPARDRVAWTKLEDLAAYRTLVAAGRTAAGGRSLALWELMEYEREREVFS